MPEMPQRETQEMHEQSDVPVPTPRKKICKWDGECAHSYTCKCRQEIEGMKFGNAG